MQLRRVMKLRVEKAKSGRARIYAVTIPKDFVEALGWREGMELEVILDTEKRLIIIKASER